MRYGAILCESWKSLWRSWALWGFLATWLGATVVGMVVIAVGITGLFSTALSGTTPDAVAIAVFSGVAALVGLVLVPVYWLFHGGAIHLANEALSGRPVRFRDGFTAGRHRIGALAGFEVMCYLILMLVGIVVVIVFGIAIAGVIASSAGGSGDAAGAMVTGAIGAVCCLEVVIIVLGIAATLIIQGFEAIGARAAVLSGRSGSEAFSDAWGALRRSFKSVIVMSLIVFGVTWVWSMASSIVMTPLQFLLSPMTRTDVFADPTSIGTDPASFFGAFGLLYAVIMVASLALNFPITVYLYLVWTGFYRQLVGIVPAEQLVPAPVSPGYVPGPPVGPVGQPGAIPPPPPPPAPTPPTSTAPTPPAPPADPGSGVE